MKISLNKTFSSKISGEWGDDDPLGKGVYIVRTANFNNDGSIDFSKLVSRLIQKDAKDLNGKVKKLPDGKNEREIDLKKIDEKKLLNGDIIIEKSGGGLGTPVGRVVFFSNPDNKIYLSNNFTQTLRVNTDIAVPKYIYYYLRYLYGKGNVLKYQNQTTGLFNLKLEKYFQEEIYLPEHSKQYAVVAQLDAIQELILKRIKSIDIVDDLIESIYFEMFGNPVENSKGWKKKKLSSIGVWATGGTPKTSIQDYYNGNIPWFNSGELNNIFINKSGKSISEKAIKESNAKLISPNSIMIGLYDTAAFKMSICKIECSCNQAILYSKIEEQENTLFVYYTLLLSKEYYLSKRKGARQKNLSSSLVKNIEIIYPANREQKNLVGKFNSLFENYYSIKQKNGEALEVLQNLFQSVLQSAFSPNIQIDEKPIFKELIKSLNVSDLKGNKKRLKYLLELFEENQFDNDDDYFETKDKLFQLILAKEIEQKVDENKIILQVK